MTFVMCSNGRREMSQSEIALDNPHKNPTNGSVKKLDKNNCVSTVYVAGTRAEIGVDRLRLGLRFQNPSDPSYTGVREWVDSVHKGDFGPGNTFFCIKGSKMPCGKQLLPGGGYLRVTYGRRKGCCVAYVQFNPRKCEADELNAHLNLMLEGGLHTLLEAAKAVEFEIAADFMPERYADFDYLREGARVSRASFQSKGTQYLGARMASNATKIYSKRKEMMDTQGIDIGEERLRVEATLRNSCAVPFSAVASIKNPFDRIIVVDKAKLEASHTPTLVTLRHAAMGMTCLHEAYCGMSKAARKKVRADLSKVAPPWWQPEEIWKSFPDSLKWTQEFLAYS